MSISELWDKLSVRQTARHKTRAEKWKALVKAIASGKPPKPDAIDDALDEAGKSAEDLRAAVALYERRLVARQKADAARDRASEETAIAGAMVAAGEILNAKVAAAEREFAAAMAPLQARLETAQLVQRAGKAAEQMLADTAEQMPGEEKELARLRKELQAARQREAVSLGAARAAEDKAYRATQRANAARGVGVRLSDYEEQKERLLQEAKEHGEEEKAQRAAAAEQAPQVAALAKQVAALEAEIEARRREP